MRSWPIKGATGAINQGAKISIAGLCGLAIVPLLDAAYSPTIAANPVVKQITKVVQPRERQGTDEHLTTLGYKYLQKGWADAAIAAFQTAIQRYPKSVKAHLGLAQAYEKNGAIEPAWQQYQKVIQLEPSNRTALQQIGIMGEYRPAWQSAGITALNQLLKQNPKNSQARLQRALLLGYQGEFEAAWADYAQLDMAQFSRQALLKAGEAAGFSGQTKIAVGLYDRALAATPDDLAIKLERAYFGIQAQQVSEATGTELLEQWLNQNPQQITRAVANLAGVLPVNPQWQTLYDRILAQFPQQLTIHQRALQVLAMQAPEAAQTAAMRLVQNNPNQAYAYFIQGDIARRTGNLDLAAQAYESLLAKQPEQIDALMSLGGVRFEQGRFEVAQKLFAQVLGYDRDHLAARRVMADLYAVQDQPLEALRLLRQVREIQMRQGIEDRQVQVRIAQLEYSTLRRRSFQTPWEGY